MNTQTPTIISWSGGKDSLMALWKLPAEYRAATLLTNVNIEQNRVSIHRVRTSLIQMQAAALGLNIKFVQLPAKPTNIEYEVRLTSVLAVFQAQSIQHVVYGDLFLQEIRQYRDAYLQRLGMTSIYPLWKTDTRTLIREFIDTGFKAVITCVDLTQLDGSFVGRVIDHSLVNDLPDSVDPCGENGEFHTFAYDGPLFKQLIPFTVGALETDEQRFCWCDLK